MRVFSKLMMSAAALALAGGIAAANAAPMVGKLAGSSNVELVAAKKAAAKKKKAGPGSCGVAKYWDKKTKSCADATKKK